MSTLIALENIRFSRAKRLILNDVNLNVNRGEITALIGGNGAGKTTLLCISAQLFMPDSGRVRYPEGRPRIGWAGDKPALYPDWTAGMFLAWQAEMQGADKAVLAQVIKDCHLAEVLHMPCSALSHGYRQRVSLAQALLVQPDVLMADEPSNGLDPQQRATLRTILRNAAAAAAVLMIHHDIDEVLALSDRIYELDNGILREIPLPEPELLWCEWQNAAAAACAPHPVHQFGCFTAHRGGIEPLAQAAQLTAISRRLPAAAFSLYRQSL